MFTGALKWGIIAAVVASVLGSGAIIVHQYKASIQAADAAAIDKATAEANAEAAQRTIEGILTDAANAENRAKADAAQKGIINATTRTFTCSGSPAFRALVVGVRSANGGAVGSPSGASRVGVGVPAAAPATR